MPAPRKYPAELRERLVREAREQEPGLSLTAAVKRVGVPPGHAARLVQAGSGRRRPGSWDDHCGRQADHGTRTRGHRAQAGERDPAGSLELFARELAPRPATAVVAAFIDDHKARFGVEPITRMLTEHGVMIAATTYAAVTSRVSLAMM